MSVSITRVGVDQSLQIDTAKRQVPFLVASSFLCSSAKVCFFPPATPSLLYISPRSRRYQLHSNLSIMTAPGILPGLWYVRPRYLSLIVCTIGPVDSFPLCLRGWLANDPLEIIFVTTNECFYDIKRL